MPRGLSRVLSHKYDILSRLSEGRFSVVHLVADKRTGCWFVLKMIPTRFSVGEHDILRSLQHPNIVELFEFSQTATHYNLVIEYLGGGNLKQRILQYGRLSESTTRIFFLQMCKAVEYLHRLRVLHGDLKPDNMLLACPSEVTLLKICDFGISQEEHEHYLTTACSTKLFRAPEFWRSRRQNYKVDIWSLGVTLYNCLSGYLPFENSKDICSRNCRFDHSVWDSISDQPKTIIRRFLTKFFNARPNIYFAINMYWLKNRAIITAYENLIN